MSDPLYDIIETNISQSTPSTSQTGFGIAMILGPNASFTDRIQYFGKGDLVSLAAVLVGGTKAPEYIAASKYFAQNPSPTQIAVGRQLASTIVITDNAGTFTGGNVKCTVGGSLITENFSSDKDTSMTALAAAIAAKTGVSSAVYSNTGHTITITLATPGTIPISIDFSGVTGTMTAVIASTANETITDALNAIVLENNDWFGFGITSRTISDQELACDWVESATQKYFLCASSDSNITGSPSETSSVPYYIKSHGYLKSKCIYSGDQANYPEMATFGAILWRNPGSYNVMFTTLNGIAVDNLTTTQRKNALGKYALTYQYIHGKNMLSETAASGNGYIDCQIFVDWLTAREAESVFGVISNKTATMGKVPYTPSGIQGIADSMEAPLKTAQANNAVGEKEFDDDGNQIGGYWIIVPKFSTIPTTDKAARTLNNMQFVVIYASAIQKVQINGNVIF